MKILRNENEIIYYKDNFIDIKECNYWISLSKKIPKNIRTQYNYPNNEIWDYRIVKITQSSIVSKVQNFLNKQLNYNLEIDEAEIQNWVDGSISPLHKHIGCSEGVRSKNRFNSLLYLNDNFEGGSFYTKGNINIKPKPGLLTLFDGASIEHGVKQVSNGDRYTIIFWWN